MLSEQLVYSGYITALSLMSVHMMADSLDPFGHDDRRSGDRRGPDRRGPDRRQVQRFRCFEHRTGPRRARSRRQLERRGEIAIAA